MLVFISRLLNLLIMTMKLKTFSLNEEDLENIDFVRKHYGEISRSEAIRRVFHIQRELLAHA